MVSRRLESEGLTPQQEEGQVEGGAEAFASRGETEEVWYSDVLHPIAGVQIAPPIRAGEQAGDLAEYDLAEHSDAASYEPALLLHAPGQEPMWVNPPAWAPRQLYSDVFVEESDPAENCIPISNRLQHARAGFTREEGEALDRAATVIGRMAKSCLERARAASSSASDWKCE